MCSAGSRLIVEDTVAERVIGKIRERMTHLRVGDSLDKVREGGREGVGGWVIWYVLKPGCFIGWLHVYAHTHAHTGC